MNLIKPKNLKEGDTICIIAPSGEVDFEKITRAAEYFRHKNFNVVLGANIRKSVNCLAGSDEERLDDLHNAFLDKSIDAVICARGGYGALRLIGKIDYSIIRNNPKIFCGYSDITILNTVIYKKCRLVTFSGAMAQSDFAGEINSYTEKSFFDTLSGKSSVIMPMCVKDAPQGEKKASGILFGGNLSTMTSLCGTDFIPEEKFIFFTEDINEPAYKIDRYFTQLLNVSQFKNNLSAIVCGDFINVDNKEYLENLLNSLEAELKIPVLMDYPISHSSVKATVPVGGFAQLSGRNLYISDYIFED